MNYMPKIDRRSFLVGTAAVGGGLSLGIAVPFGADTALAQSSKPELNAWVVVRPDDTVVIRIARAEMGQGSQTGLAQLVAEELECDWSKVTTEIPTPGENVARKRVWGNFNSSGSRAIRESQEYVRKGGAAAAKCSCRPRPANGACRFPSSRSPRGVITHKASNRSTTYGKVADAAAKLEPPADVKLKDPKDWTIIGKPLKRLDTADKVTGKQKYSIDFTMPGMLCAAMKECPVFGGKIKSFDAAKITNMPGVKKVVQSGDAAVAVVADTWWQAKTALAALPIEWDEGETPRRPARRSPSGSRAVSTRKRRSSATRAETPRTRSQRRRRRSRRSTPIRTRTTPPWSR
jgi:isoquinoline 1-oxidoreductase beta subunit